MILCDCMCIGRTTGQTDIQTVRRSRPSRELDAQWISQSHKRRGTGRTKEQTDENSASLSRTSIPTNLDAAIETQKRMINISASAPKPWQPKRTPVPYQSSHTAAVGPLILTDFHLNGTQHLQSLT